MVERYAREEMSSKWTMQAKYQAWLDVEKAVVKAWAKLGKIPQEDADKIVKNAGFDNLSISAEKGIGRFPRRIWRRENWPQIRKWIVRWCWLQVFKAEIPWERLDEISFELNLTAVATKA